MNIFQKLFQLSKQEGHGYHIHNGNQFWKFCAYGPFRVAGHIMSNNVQLLWIVSLF